MRVHAACWLLVAGATTGVAGAGLVTTAGWGPAIATVTVLGLLAGVLSYLWHEAFELGTGSVARGAVGSCAGAVVFLGLPLAAGRSGFLVMAALGLTCPPLVRRIVRLPAGRIGRVDGPDTMENALLALAWVDTTHRLRAAATPAETLAVVEERARLLDDLEQRDPEILRALLTSTMA